MKIRSLIRGRPGVPPPPSFSQDIVHPPAVDEVRSHAGETFQCLTRSSLSGDWVVSYGIAPATEQSRVFVFRSGELITVLEISRVSDAGIGNNGALILLHGQAADSLGGYISVFDPSGTRVLHEAVPVNLRNCTISSDGAWVAAVTRPPDVTMYLISVDEREVVEQITMGEEPMRLLGFTKSTDSRLVYLAKPPRDEPYAAFETSGELAWRSRRYRDTQPFTERIKQWLRSSQTGEQ